MERREDKTARGSKKNKGKQKYIATEDMFLHDNNNFWRKKKNRKKEKILHPLTQTPWGVNNCTVGSHISAVDTSAK